MKNYLDTSVLVSLYVPEHCTGRVISYLSNNEAQIYLSRLTETEFYSAIATKLRTNELSKKQALRLTNAFNEDLKALVYQKIYISDEMFQKAIEFLSVNETNLRTLDALHLACTWVVNANLLTADRHLAKAANHFKLSFHLF